LGWDRVGALAARSPISAGDITVHADINKLTMSALATFKSGEARQCSERERSDRQNSDARKMKLQHSPDAAGGHWMIFAKPC
jgi:hypothetical protein